MRTCPHQAYCILFFQIAAGLNNSSLSSIRHTCKAGNRFLRSATVRDALESTSAILSTLDILTRQRRLITFERSSSTCVSNSLAMANNHPVLKIRWRLNDPRNNWLALSGAHMHSQYGRSRTYEILAWGKGFGEGFTDSNGTSAIQIHQDKDVLVVLRHTRAVKGNAEGSDHNVHVAI